MSCQISITTVILLYFHIVCRVHRQMIPVGERQIDFCFHRGSFSGLSHISDLKTGIPVASRPGICCFRVSAGTDWSGVSVLWLCEIESLICSFYLNVAARTIEQNRPLYNYVGTKACGIATQCLYLNHLSFTLARPLTPPSSVCGCVP